jgi:MFS family permease
MGFLIMPLVGRLADVRGRRHLIWGGYLLLLISRATQGLARVWQHLIPAKMLYQVGRGVRNPPREALLADSVPSSYRGRAFGLLGSMDTFGAVIGPLIGITLFQLFLNIGVGLDEAYRWIFFCAAAPTTMSILLILLGTREVLTEAPKSERSRRRLGLSILVRDKTLLSLTLVTMLFTFWNVSENFMLVCGARVLGIPKEAFWATVLLYWLINISFAPTAYLAGRFSDRFGRKTPVILGMIILGGLTMGFAYAFNFPAVGLLFLLHGVYQGLYRPNIQAWVADLAPREQRAEVIGTYKMLVGLSDIPGPFFFGLIWDLFGLRTPFIVGGLFCLLCALIVLLMIPKRRKP